MSKASLEEMRIQLLKMYNSGRLHCADENGKPAELNALNVKMIPKEQLADTWAQIQAAQETSVPKTDCLDPGKFTLKDGKWFVRT